MKFDELVNDLSEYLTHEQKMLDMHLQIEDQNERKLQKAHEIWTRRIFKKYGPLESWQLWNEDRQRKAFLEAYVETGDTRCLIDYFQLRKPQDYRYFEKAFREALMMSVFRQYDEVRYILFFYST